ncbi:hypothetical protein ACVIRO_006185 [Rhizobium ruizarguesonis]
MVVAARGNRAHDIGDVEFALVAFCAVEGGNEAIVAEFGMGSGDLSDPVEIRHLGAVDEVRIVDLEAGRQKIGDDDARRPGVGFAHMDDDDVALVLLRLADIRLFAVECVIGALDGEAVAAGRQRHGGRGNRGDDGRNRVTRLVGQRQRMVAQRIAGYLRHIGTGMRRAVDIDLEAVVTALDGAGGKQHPGLFLGALIFAATPFLGDGLGKLRDDRRHRPAFGGERQDRRPVAQDRAVVGARQVHA